MLKLSSKRFKITVTGDVCVDWLLLPTKPKDVGLNWELYPGSRMIARSGGALLLSDLLRKSTDAVVLSPKLEAIEEISPEKILHSNLELSLFPFSSDPKDKNKPVYRVKKFLGFSGPTAGTPGLLPLEKDDPDADMVVLDDAGNGFREKKEYWPKAILEDGKKPFVVYKMSSPLTSGKLWDHLRSFHARAPSVIDLERKYFPTI